MRTIEEIMAAMQAILDAAEGRNLSNDEVLEYEGLEAELKEAQQSQNIRQRNAAYNVVRTPAGVPSRGGSGTDDGMTDLDRAFDNYLRTGMPNADISGLRVTNAQGEGSSAAGGYLVPNGFRQKMVEVREAFGGFAANAETITTDSGNPLEYPTNDDTANEGTITEEGESVADGADMVFGTVSLGAYKYTSSGANNAPLRVSVELLQDSAFDLRGFIARKLGQRIMRKQANHWINGTGVGEPKGIVADSLTPDLDLDTADTIAYGDLVEIQDLLDEEYDPNAKWLMRKNTWSQIRLITDTNGRPIVQSSTEGISTRPARMLLDREVIIDEDMPLLSDAGATYPIAYGDFRESYVIRRVSNLVVVVNPYSRAANGEVEFTAWERADGTIQNRSSYVIMQNNT